MDHYDNTLVCVCVCLCTEPYSRMCRMQQALRDFFIFLLLFFNFLLLYLSGHINEALKSQMFHLQEVW